MLEIAVASLYFLNKIYLSLDKRTGWLLGILASSLAIIYFITLKFYIIIALEVGMLGLMVYGLVNYQKKRSVDVYVYPFMILIMGVLLYAVPTTGWLEFIISLLFMGALFFLARKKWHLGWILLGIGHALMCFFTYQNGEYFFSSLQGASVFVAIYALFQKREVREENLEEKRD